MIQELKKDKILIASLILGLVSVVSLIMIFAPVLKKEIEYSTGLKKAATDIRIVQKNSYILSIPKIALEKEIIINVDPLNYSEYTEKLKNGIAHAKGTDLPGGEKSSFLFSHSSVSIFDEYDPDFYLLDKLNKNDQIIVNTPDSVVTYEITDKKIINRTEIEYLTSKEKDEILLMTCWPLGTDLKRLLIQAKKLSNP